MGSVLGSVLVLPLSRREPGEVLEDRLRPLEAFAVLVREERDLVLAVPVFLPRGGLFRDEVDAELGQPLADGGRERAPLGLVEREHTAMLVRPDNV
jgi:hypothetical protein